MEEFEVVESAALEPVGKRWKARLVKAGWGAQMNYPAEVLQRDGAKVFKAGTPIFIDHLTPDDKEFYQFGKVQNFAGVLATDAVWDSEEQALFAEVEIFEHQQALVKSLAGHVGLSIRAQASFNRETVDGRTGRVANELLKARSVDLVVRAGAGGGLVEALESAIDTEINEGTENIMDEATAAKFQELTDSLDSRFGALDTRISEVQESLLAELNAEEEVKEEVETAPSTLTAEEVAKMITDALADAAAAVKVETQESDIEGIVENESDVEESARESKELRLPAAWVVKESK